MDPLKVSRVPLEAHRAHFESCYSSEFSVPVLVKLLSNLKS